MKKFLTTLTILAAMVAVASAGVGIQWETGWGGYTADAPNVTDDPSDYAILDNSSVIWQLIYAGADNMINPIPTDVIPTPGGPNGDYVQGDDEVWAQREIAMIAQPNLPPTGTSTAGDGTEWNNFLVRVSGDATYVDLSWSTAGFVYQRIFEGTPAQGSWWYDSPLFAFDETWTDSLAPEMFNPEVDINTGGFQGTNQFDAIPEPATMSLLGLGALVMAIRRRRA